MNKYTFLVLGTRKPLNLGRNKSKLGLQRVGTQNICTTSVLEEPPASSQIPHLRGGAPAPPTPPNILSRPPASLIIGCLMNRNK